MNKMREIIRAAWRSLTRRPSRTALTVSGITVGVVMVVLVSLIGSMGMAVVEGELESMGLTGLSVSTVENRRLKLSDLARVRAVSGVAEAAPLMIEMTTATMRGTTDTAVVCGIDAGATQVISLELLHGRLITTGDVLAGARCCVLDEQVARAAYGRANVVGKSITVKLGGVLESFTVVGITRTGSTVFAALSEMVPGMVYVPYTAIQSLTGRDTLDQIAVRTAADADPEAVRNRLAHTMSRAATATYTVENLSSQRDKLSGLMDMVVWILTAISAISLVVSGLGIMTIMLVSVSERTREIGIKKALGASKGRICAEFLAESVVLAAIGSAAGLLLGLTAGGAAAALAGIPFSIPWARLLVAAAITLGIGAVFGVYPSLKAASLPPVDALRSQ